MILDDRDIIVVRRTPDRGVLAEILSCEPDGRTQPLPHVVRHSPTGFEYGYGGSGPADLALSILCACSDHAIASRLYQAFKFERIAPETAASWTMKVGQVREWLEHQETET